jgi:hypothetical protein
MKNIGECKTTALANYGEQNGIWKEGLESTSDFSRLYH